MSWARRWGAVGLVALGVLGPGCAQSEIWREEAKDNLIGLVLGSDRGLAYYQRQISKSVDRERGTRSYRYSGSIQTSNYRVLASVRGIGSTELRDVAEMARAVNTLFLVADWDPTAGIRAQACHELGKLLLRMPLAPVDDSPEDVRATAVINRAARDLRDLQAKIEAKEKVTQGQVVDRLEVLCNAIPLDFRSARQQILALASRPVNNAAGAVRQTLDRLGPRCLRRAMLVALRDKAAGDPDALRARPDVSPIVRRDAAKALTRIASPVARTAVILRLVDPYDPLERDADVRANLVRYLGRVGDADAFEVCLRRLEDENGGVRFHAHRALQDMTGARLRAEVEVWKKYRQAHPEWQQSEDKRPDGDGTPGLSEEN